MTIIQPPLDPSKLSSGTWAEWWLTSGTTGSGAYYYNAPSIDINGNNLTYNQNHGAWQDSNGGYQGWWWANESDLTYEGTNYDGQSIVVLDADGNSIYDAEVDYIIGYAFGWDNGGTSGNWDRTSDYEGIFSGGAFGVFKITVEMNYSGSNGDDTVLGSTKSDTLRGNRGNDEIYGYEFSDNLFGGDGNDNLNGGSGDDTLDGGAGDDTLIGGTGDDTYVVDSTSDTVTEGSSAGTDLIQSSVSFTASNNVENLTLTGSGNIEATGNSSDNTLTGNSGNNTLNGGSGDDTLVGGAGTDTAQFSADLYNYTVWKSADNQTIKITDNTANRDGTDSLTTIENLTFNSTTYTSSNLRNGAFLSSDGYKLIGSSGIYTLKTNIGSTYSDDSTSEWDITAAKESGSGFDVLLEGSTGTNREGYNYIWSTNSSGVITSGSSWITDAETESHANGYENKFGKDFNSDGLISGGSAYQLLGSSGIYTLKTNIGSTYSDDSSSEWDITAAKESGSGFDVLLEGSTGTNREGYNYIWSTNSSGVITSGSSWITDAETESHANGYENKFGKDFNSDGLISGGSAYQLLGSSGIYTLKTNIGSTYSDDSTSEWDITAAKESGSGFDVLLEGSTGTNREGYNYIWSTNSSGVITSGSSWLTDAETESHANGYENKFGKDFNSDGLISGGSAYQLLGSSGIYTLKTNIGSTYSDDSSSEWDITAAKESGSGFDVLLEGSTGTNREGYNYIWSTNSSGVITSGSSWITDAETESHANGYENKFGKDFNSDGLISGGSAYQLLGSSGIYTLKTNIGSTYSDDSTSEWDITAAKESGSGFDVLLEGSTGTNREGYNYIWSTNSSGVITSGSSWLTDAQTTSSGYESIFNIDFNKNGIID